VGAYDIDEEEVSTTRLMKVMKKTKRGQEEGSDDIVSNTCNTDGPIPILFFVVLQHEGGGG